MRAIACAMSALQAEEHLRSDGEGARCDMRCCIVWLRAAAAAVAAAAARALSLPNQARQLFTPGLYTVPVGLAVVCKAQDCGRRRRAEVADMQRADVVERNDCGFKARGCGDADRDGHDRALRKPGDAAAAVDDEVAGVRGDKQVVRPAWQPAARALRAFAAEAA